MRCLGSLLLALIAPLPAQQPGVQGFRELRLEGRGYARGLQHGKAMAGEIRVLLAAIEADLRRQHPRQEPRDFLRRMLERSRFEQAVRFHTPDLHAEVHGIADGAGLPFWRIFALQLIDEQWVMGGRLQAHKCSGLGIDRQGSQPTLVAQNLDIPPFMHTQHLLLRIVPPKPAKECLVVSLPGLIGACGLNAGRVAVSVNSLLQLQPRADGLPVAFVVRGLLARDSWAAARQFLYAIPHASGQNYILGGPQVARSYECSGFRLRRFLPGPGAVVCFHTNHPLVNQDWNPAWLAGLDGAEPLASLPDCPRLAGLRAVLTGGRPPGLRGVEELLRMTVAPGGKPAPISNPGTFAGVIMALGSEPELRVSAGRPDRGRFVKFRFER